jgi:hypothetical protein
MNAKPSSAALTSPALEQCQLALDLTLYTNHFTTNMDSSTHEFIDPHTTTADTTMAHASDDQNTAAVARIDSPLSLPKTTPTQDDYTGVTLLDLSSEPTSEGSTHASPFIRLPAELRVRIYELLLLPSPAALVHCDGFCSAGDEFLACTCKPVSSRTRAYKCGHCAWRGAEVHVSVMRTCKQIYKEAAAVLYEHVEYRARHRSEAKDIPAHLAVHVQTMNFIHPVRQMCSAGLWAFHGRLRDFPNLRLVRLHVDWDAAWSRYPALVEDIVNADAVEFDGLVSMFGEQVEFEVDVHVTQAWSADDGDWVEKLVSRKGHEERAKQLDIIAVQARQHVVSVLRAASKRWRTVLNIRENRVM